MVSFLCIAVDMLQKLQQTPDVNIIQGRNNALAIIDALNWKSASEAIKDLKSLVIAENSQHAAARKLVAM